MAQSLISASGHVPEIVSQGVRAGAAEHHVHHAMDAHQELPPPHGGGAVHQRRRCAPPPLLPVPLQFSLVNTQKIVPNIRNFSIYSGTRAYCPTDYYTSWSYCLGSPEVLIGYLGTATILAVIQCLALLRYGCLLPRV